MSDKTPTDATLLGFLLGGLDASEQTRIAQQLENNPQLVERLVQLQRLLKPLDEDQEVFEPAGDLTARTLDGIVRHTSQTQPNSPSHSAGEGVCRFVAPTQTTWFDFLATSAATFIAAALLFPGLLGSREVARQFACTNNLQLIGRALGTFASHDRGFHIPQLDTNGPMAFSGAYAIQLNDAGLLEESSWRLCPTLGEPLWVGLELPSKEQLLRAPIQRLCFWQRIAGGNYAYNLGVLVNGRYESPRLDGQCNVPVLADAPVIEGERNVWLSHSGRGINMLFDDGHVSFVRLVPAIDLPDDPYFNRQGKRERGVDRTDGSLGPSSVPPMGWSPKKL